MFILTDDFDENRLVLAIENQVFFAVVIPNKNSNINFVNNITSS